MITALVSLGMLALTAFIAWLTLRTPPLRAERECSNGHRWPAPVDGPWTAVVEVPTPRCPLCGAFCIHTVFTRGRP